jgi:type IV pilus assembly protein PilE
MRKFDTKSRLSNCTGFTLIELMIVVAVVALLSAITFPSYSQHIKKQRIRAAQADLIGLVLNMENQYALSSPNSYPAATNTTDSTRQRVNSGWSPTQTAHFRFEILESSSTFYKIRAVGISSFLLNCDISIDSLNNRSLSSACGGGGTWF